MYGVRQGTVPASVNAEKIKGREELRGSEEKQGFGDKLGRNNKRGFSLQINACKTGKLESTPTTVYQHASTSGKG